MRGLRPPPAGTDHTLLGVALMLGFCTIAPLIDVASKLAAVNGVPVGMVTFLRFVVQAVLMAPVAWWMGTGLAIPRRALALSLARAFVSVTSTWCFIAALKFMPIADALAIVFVEPFIILLIGRFALAEQVGPRRIAAAILGFVGSLLVIQPAFDRFGPVALLPLGTALSFALYILLTRALSRHVHPVAMQTQTAVLAGLLCLPFFALGRVLPDPSLAMVWPTGIDLVWCIGVGLAATISHMSMTFALRFAPSATLAPLHYLEMVPAVLFAYLVFGDFPDLLTWCGIGVIFASGLYIIHRERLAARDRPAIEGLTESP